jgi:replicative DNA helicase
MISRIPSHDTELEQLVLGAILLEGRTMTSVMAHLSPERFYDPKNATIFEAMAELYTQNSPIDLLTVTKAVRKKRLLDQAGGPSYIANLTSRVASTANIDQWCLFLNEHYMKREFARISSQVHDLSFDGATDVFEIYDRFTGQMSQIFNKSVKTTMSHVSEFTEKISEMVISRETSTNGFSGLATGIYSVDRIIGGHQKSDLMYMAGRPGMGKTAMALSEMLSMAVHGVPVAFFSLEMSSSQVILRLLSMLTGIDGSKLMKYKLDTDELRLFQSKKDYLNMLPIYIDDTAGLSVLDLRTRVKTMVEKHSVSIVYVDYVQLLSSGTRKHGQNREQELSTISRNLKLIAKECDVPVIALSQLSRAVEARAEKRPMLSDLRESGSLEQDADIVVFLYRPEYYGVVADEAGNSVEGLGEYIVAKQRNGSTGIARMRFLPNVMRYIEYSNQIKNEPLPF